jgi:prepilin-type N-terminal cleavage/methylation domain-containing protein
MQRGFSLVELSIVLVILGLLTGGILAGQSLIRASELRAVSTEYQRWATAAATFRDKYFAVPGDMSNATSFWGKNATDCNAHTGAAATPGTCNGNGDGMITDAAGAGLTGERFQFWKQLSLAGIVEGNYTGLAGSGGANHTVISTNGPSSKLGSGGWTAVYVASPFVGNTTFYAGEYLNHLRFGAASATGASHTALLKPEEAWNIDTKTDDGEPATGRIIAIYWNNLCSAADDGTHSELDLVASYRLTDSTPQCALNFTKAF